MILLRFTRKPILFTRNFLSIYSFSSQDSQDPFRILSIDKLLKLSASKKYQYPNEIQLYTTILNSLMKRGPQIDYYRSIVDEQFNNIVLYATKNISRANKKDFLKFSIAIFEGVSKRIFYCDQNLFIKFIQEFKIAFMKILESDKSGEYYTEVKNLSMHLISLRKGSFLLQDIVFYLETHSKSDAQTLQLIETLYQLSYKATGNLTKAVERLLNQTIQNKLQLISKNPQSHILLDDTILKVYARFRLHLKRPFMDVNQWIFFYVKLLFQKYTTENNRNPSLKKISFMKNLLRIYNEMPISTKKREVDEQNLEEIVNYIDRLFGNINCIDYQDTYGKLFEFISLIEQYKQFIFKNPQIYIEPLNKSLYEIMVELYRNFIKEMPYLKDITLSIQFVRFLAKYVKIYIKLEKQCIFQNHSTTFVYFFQGFSQRKSSKTDELLQTVSDAIWAFQKNNSNNWDSLILYESVALLCESKFIKKEQKCKKIIDELIKLFNNKIQALPYDVIANTRFYLFTKYLGISTLKADIKLDDTMKKNSFDFFSEYAIQSLKSNFILECIRDLDEKNLLKVNQDSVGAVICSLKPEDGKIISNQIYEYWFHEKKQLFMQLIENKECWILINVAFRFQFSKIHPISIDFMTEIIQLSYFFQKKKQNTEDGKKPILSDFLINQINKIYRDQIVHNSLISKTNSMTEYKYLILITALAQWNLNPKHQISEQNYVNFRSLVDFLHFALIDWENPLYVNTFRARLLEQIVKITMQKCYARERESLNYMKGASLQKIFYWIAQFDCNSDQIWVSNVNINQFLMFVKSKYSRIHTWDIILSLKPMQNVKNKEILSKIENMLINEDDMSFQSIWKKSSVGIIDLKNIYNFLRNQNVCEDLIKIISDYELKMILVHKFIALSGTKKSLKVALERFFKSGIRLTYPQFCIFVHILMKLMKENRIEDEYLLKTIMSWVPKRFYEFSENLTEKFLIQYFCICQTFGQIPKIEKKIQIYLIKLMKRANIDIIEFLYKRKQMISNSLEYSDFLTTLKIKNIMAEHYEIEAVIIKVEVILIYLYGSVIFQNNLSLLSQFHDHFIDKADLSFVYESLEQLSEQYLPKMLLRDMILKRKLPNIKQSTFRERITKNNPQLVHEIENQINEMIQKKLSSQQDKNYHRIPNTNIQISDSAVERIRNYLHPSFLFGTGSLNLDAEQELMLIYLTTFIDPNAKYSTLVARS